MSRLRAKAILGALISEGILNTAEIRKRKKTEEPTAAVILVDDELITRMKEIRASSLTGVLEISGQLIKSFIHFNQGVIVQAYHGTAAGKKGLFRIFSEQGSAYDFRPIQVENEPVMDDDLNSLLIEGSEEIKWKQRLTKGELDIQVTILPNAFEEVLKESPYPDLSATLRIIDKKKMVRDIIETSPLSDLETYNRLIYMKSFGIIRIEGKKINIPSTFDNEYKISNIQIVIDSSADLPEQVVTEHDIKIIPFNIQFGKKVFLDGVDFTNDRFLELSEKSNNIPRTYSASDEEIHTLFKTIIAEKDILGIFMSQKLGGTKDISGIFMSQQTSSMYENAISALKKNYNIYSALRMGQYGHGDPPNTEIIDSKQISMGTGLLIMEAIEKIEAGWSITQIRAHIEELIPNVRVLLMVNSQKYLKHGWKITTKDKSVDSIISVKNPILGIQNGSGELEVIAHVKSDNDGLDQFENLIREDLLQYLGPSIKAAVIHNNNPLWAEKMINLVKKRFKCESLVQSQIGPVVSSNCGPGVVGVAYFPVIVK